MKIAQLLTAGRHEVTIIDRDADALHRMSESGCRLIVGDAIDSEILRKAGIEEADCFLALTGEDNANLFAAQAARELFRVKKVIVRVADPKRARAFAEMGLTTICATDLIADAVNAEIARKKS